MSFSLAYRLLILAVNRKWTDLLLV